MTEARVERRLAAILAADVAGYSRLMGADEEGTLAALKGDINQRREGIERHLDEIELFIKPRLCTVRRSGTRVAPPLAVIPD